MKPLIVTIVAIAVLPISGIAAGLPPWRFGMSKSEVVSFKEFSPYKDFSNGDVETLNGRFHGAKTNIQFFFQGGRLRRIGVYMFEGTDAKQGIPVFRRAYEALQKDYGKIAMPDVHVDAKSAPVNADVLAIAAAANADITGQTVMAPAKQPSDMHVLGRFWTGNVQGRKWYYVALFFDAHA
jgi:hypothetical protein